MAVSSEKIIKQTKCWISEVIIAFNFCPFAKRELDNNNVNFEVFTNAKITTALEEFIIECSHLDSTPEIETSLLIFPNDFLNFNDYLELVALANDLLVTQGYEGIYQLASFHPDYCFAETNQDDASNYTNRSPYPMLHILRESSLSKALKDYSEPENIPVNNIEKSRELGNSVFQNILSNCKK